MSKTDETVGAMCKAYDHARSDRFCRSVREYMIRSLETTKPAWETGPQATPSDAT